MTDPRNNPLSWLPLTLIRWYSYDISVINVWYSWNVSVINVWYSWDISEIFLCQFEPSSLIRCGPKVIEATWCRQSRIGDKKWGIIWVGLCQTWLDRTPPNISSWPPCLTHHFSGNDEILLEWMLKIQLWKLIQGGWVLWSKVSKRSPHPDPDFKRSSHPSAD